MSIEQPEEQKSSGSAANQMTESVSGAWEQFTQAILVLGLALIWIALQALRALAMLAVPALRLGAVAIMGYGVLALFNAIGNAYGADLPAVMLALSMSLVVPAFLLAVPSDRTWGAMLASGALSTGAAWLLERAPPPVLALLPSLVLAACVMRFLYPPAAKPEQAETQKGETPND